MIFKIGGSLINTFFQQNLKTKQKSSLVIVFAITTRYKLYIVNSQRTYSTTTSPISGEAGGFKIILGKYPGVGSELASLVFSV